MKEHPSTIEVWTPEVWRLKWGAFALSCLLAFLIVIPALAFWLYLVCLCRQSAFVSARGSETSILKGFKVI
jgi:hypothetical protein